MKLPKLNSMDTFKHQVWLVTVVGVLISLLNLPLAKGYCWEPGRNPYFTGPPVVQQVDLRTVRVTWEGLIEEVECADQFLVKYWQKNTPQAWILTDLLKTDQFTIDIEIIPKVDYVYQVIAREDKGSIAGIDYNKSEYKEFKTSAYNSEVKPSPKVPTPVSSPVAPEYSLDDLPTDSSQNEPEKEGAVGKENAAILMAGLSIELLAIIVVCSIVLLLILVGLIYKLACAKKSEDIEDDEDDDDDEDDFEKERLDV